MPLGRSHLASDLYQLSGRRIVLFQVPIPTMKFVLLQKVSLGLKPLDVAKDLPLSVRDQQGLSRIAAKRLDQAVVTTRIVVPREGANGGLGVLFRLLLAERLAWLLAVSRAVGSGGSFDPDRQGAGCRELEGVEVDFGHPPHPVIVIV